MFYVKFFAVMLTAVLLSFLIEPSLSMALERPLTPLPMGAQFRLGRGRVESAQFSPDSTRLAVVSEAGAWLYDTTTGDTLSLYYTFTTKINNVEFSPDSQILAGVGDDGIVRLWDTVTGSMLRTLNSHSDPAWLITFSPDGHTLASRGKVIRLWDVHTGELRHTLKVDIGLISHRDWRISPDGQTLAVVAQDESIHVFDLNSGSRYHILCCWSEYVHGLVFSPDSRFLAGAIGHNIRLWEIETGTLLHILRSPDEHGAHLDSMAFSPNGRSLASSVFVHYVKTQYSRLHIWDVDSGSLQASTLNIPESAREVKFNPDGRTLVSRNNESTTLWDAATLELLYTLDGRLWSDVYSNAFSTDDQNLATSPDYHLRLHDLDTGRLVLKVPGIHLYDYPTKLSPDGRTLALFWETRPIQLLDTAANLVRHTLGGHVPRTSSVAFSPDSQTVVSVHGEMVNLWNVATGGLFHRLAPECYNDRPNVIPLFSPGGGRIAIACERTIELRDLSTGTKQYDPEFIPWGGVTSADLSPDGRVLAYANAGDNKVRLQDFDTGKLLYTLEGKAWSVAFSPDGSVLASTGKDNTVRLWDVATAKLLYTLDGYGDKAWSVAFSPDGRFLAVPGYDNTVGLWDTENWTLHRTLRDFHGDIAFSADGRTMFSASGLNVRMWDVDTGALRIVRRMSGDGYHWLETLSPDRKTLASVKGETIYLWDVFSGTLRFQQLAHTETVTDLAFSSDGQSLASASHDGTVLIWDVVLDSAAGDFRNLETNPDGHWEVWKSESDLTVRFSSRRAPVQYHARQEPQPLFVLPEGFRPAQQITHTVVGRQVDQDGAPVQNAEPVTFDLTIDSNGEVRYVDNAKVDELGFVQYHVERLMWQNHETQELQTG